MDQKAIDKFQNALTKEIIKEFVNQGHSLTGAFEESIEFNTIEETDSLTQQVLVNFYGSYLDNGVNASNIPYSRGSGAGKSAYISALTRYATLRMGLQGKEAQSAAFAIATNHKKHGMPSPGSYQYSKNSRRTTWVDNVLAESANLINKFANELSDSIIEISINNLLKR
jgi:hypothetical protein